MSDVSRVSEPRLVVPVVTGCDVISASDATTIRGVVHGGRWSEARNPNEMGPESESPVLPLPG